MMKLSPDSRFSEEPFGWDQLKIGFSIGARNLAKPTSILRLGVIWVILDPLMLAAIYSFLFSITGRSSTAGSILIGVMTLRAFNSAFRNGYSMNLSNEPFPLKHTSTSMFLTSIISTEFLTALMIGISGSSVLIILFGAPILLLPTMSMFCCFLSILGIGLGMVLCPYVSRIADLGKLLGYVLFLSFFLQPCLYGFNSTSGIHREVLSYIPFTLSVEYLRSLTYGTEYPFDYNFAISVIAVWAFFSLIGYLGADRERWRATSWS
jgi:ABC-type polysaccharide/polyol phosphate export permease